MATVAGSLYLSGGFVWDDNTLIAQDLVNLDGAGLRHIWAGPIRDSGPGASYYRPVALTVMSILGSVGPWAIHGFTLLVHAASAVLFTRLLHGLRWPLIGGFVFALHPLVSEVLAWCSALPDALAAFLGLLCVWVWRHSTPAAMVLLLMGCLCKETAALVPMLFGVAGMLSRRWWWAWLLPCVSVAGIRFVAGVSVPGDWLAKWAMAPGAMAWSVGGLVWPFPLTAVRDLWVVPSAMFVMAGGLILVMAWFGRGSRTALAGLALVLAAPMLAIPVMLDGYLVAERYMYVGTLGLGLWGAAVVHPVTKTWFLWPLAIGLLGVHWMRAPDWKSDIALFEASVDAYPRSSYAWHLYGIALAESGQMAPAARAFQQAVLQGHPHPLDRFLCLKALVLAGEPEEALRWAQMGPTENLTAEMIAWRARAAYMAGDFGHSSSLFRMLKTDDGYDGPGWVGELVEQLHKDISKRSMINP